jgi:transcriptional regulator with XRE-family HTH domain
MEKKTWYLSPIELFIIIAIRTIRLELDITGEEISNFLEKNPKYIGHIESNAHNAKYNDTVLSKIALYLTEKAKERQKELIESKDDTIIKTEYTIYDFYPKEILGNDKILKEIEPIPAGSGPTPTLNALIEATDFFKVARTLKEIVIKANEVQNESWDASDFTRPLERAVKGKNRRLEVVLNDGGLNTYVVIKKAKKD